MKVAIIQDRDPDELDERGYWIDKDPLSKISDYRAGITNEPGKAYATVIPEFLRTAHKQASERIKAFLAIQII